MAKRSNTPNFAITALLFIISLSLINSVQAAVPLWTLNYPDTDIHQGFLGIVKISGNDQFLVATNPDASELFAVSKNGTLLWNYTPETTAGDWTSPGITGISISPDNSLIGVSTMLPGCCHGVMSRTTSNKITLFNADGHKLWNFSSREPPHSIAISGNGRNIFAGYDSGLLSCFDINGTPLWNQSTECPVSNIELSDDGNFILASGGNVAGVYTNDVYLFTRDGVLIWKKQFRGENVLGISPDSQNFLLFGDPKRKIDYLDHEGKILWESSFGSMGMAMAMAGDGQYIVVVTADNQLHLLNNKGEILWSSPTPDSVYSTAISGDGEVIGIGTDKNLTLFDRSGNVSWQFTTNATVLPVVISPDGKYIAAVSDKIYFFNRWGNTTAIEPEIHETVSGPIMRAGTSTYGNWTEITSNAGFGPRYDFGTAAFNDRLWVIGGHTQEGYMWSCSATTGTTIMSSPDDGKTWVLENVTTPVPHATCDTNDIWSSADGKTWDRVIPNAPFSPRSGMGVAVFNNRLWVIGGRVEIGGSSGNGLKNDVWSSADGINWTLVTPSADFGPRSDMGVAVFDNRLWVIAGGEEGNLKNDVWSSSDGMNWTQVTADAPFSPRYGKGVAVFDNKLWMIGGVSDSEYTDPATGYTYLNEGGSKDVWSSQDGKTWTLVNADAPFAFQEFPSVIVFDNKIWILGGGLWETMPMVTKNPPPHATNGVWSSKDGVNWTPENKTVGFSPRFLSGGTVFQNGIWVIGGTDNSRISSDVWYMPLSDSSPAPIAVVPAAYSLPPDTSAVPAVPATTAPLPALLSAVAMGLGVLASRRYRKK
jgi:hypothetical protein